MSKTKKLKNPYEEFENSLFQMIERDFEPIEPTQEFRDEEHKQKYLKDAEMTKRVLIWKNRHFLK